MAKKYPMYVIILFIRLGPIMYDILTINNHEESRSTIHYKSLI